MAAKFCPRCDLRLPALGHNFCPICFGKMNYHIADEPDEDYAERIKAASDVLCVPDKTDMNRAARFLAAGLDYDQAVEFAQARHLPGINESGGGYEVEVGEFERLVERCGVALAARIMKPLSSPDADPHRPR